MKISSKPHIFHKKSKKIQKFRKIRLTLFCFLAILPLHTEKIHILLQKNLRYPPFEGSFFLCACCGQNRRLLSFNRIIFRELNCKEFAAVNLGYSDTPVTALFRCSSDMQFALCGSFTGLGDTVFSSYGTFPALCIAGC